MISDPSASRARGRRKDSTSMLPSRGVPLTRTDFPPPACSALDSGAVAIDAATSAPVDWPTRQSPSSAPHTARPCRTLSAWPQLRAFRQYRHQWRPWASCAGWHCRLCLPISEPIDRHACILARRGGLARYVMAIGSVRLQARQQLPSDYHSVWYYPEHL